MVRGTWQATVHGVAKSWTRLSDLLSLTSGHRNFVNGCKFSNNQQDGLLSGQFDEQTVLPQGELRVPGASPPSLCSGGPRRRPVQPPGLSASGCVPGSGQSQVKVGSVTGSPAGARPQSRGQTRLRPSHCDNREGVILLTAAITEPPGPR